MTGLLRMFFKAARTGRKRQRKAAALLLPARAAKPAAKSAAKPPAKPRAKRVGRRNPSVARPPRPAPGSFISDSFSCPQGELSYRFYTPKGSAQRRMPLVVMLHGCSQSAADFAAGTDMNRLADELGVLVLYPQQSTGANIGRCWNWHDPQNHTRGRGEPAVIAAMTRHAMALGRANPARIYIAGISAGGAAAAIIGAAYPDLYVAVGVHSGVALGNIRSLRAAVTAMQGKRRGTATGKLPPQLPTIVFHGDADRVVHPGNADGFRANLERSRPGPLVCRIASGRSAGGRDFTRRVYRTKAGRVVLEDWTVHGSGHGWSGGRAAGSHTDPDGPDASREMLRFFLALRRTEAAG